MNDQSETPLVELTKFAAYLLMRVEALESLLIQKGTISKDELREAVALAQKSMGQFLLLNPQDDRSFEPVLVDTLKRLTGRFSERLE
jgi:hypothetical protein